MSEVDCPRCFSGGGSDPYWCRLCQGSGKVTQQETKDHKGTNVKVASTELEHGYSTLEKLISDRVAAIKYPIFYIANPVSLYSFFLQELGDQEQYYNCSACRSFVERFGHLVTVNAEGRLVSCLWEPEGVPEFFAKAVKALRRRVCSQKIHSVFYSNERVWGKPVTGTWTHLYGVYGLSLEKDVISKIAEKRQEYIMLKKALSNYPQSLARQAVTVLEMGGLHMNEKALAIAKWFLNVHGMIDNLIWLAVANAPPGYCHINSTMISTLLDDLKNGIDVKARWDAKMHPLQYRRPTAPLNEQNIDKAEKIIAELGLQDSLKRRYANLEDVEAVLWKPLPSQIKETGGIFDKLRGSPQNKTIQLPNQTMTWEKFRATILPHAEKIRYLVTRQLDSFYGLVAPWYRNCPKIIQWDNQITWFMYHQSSHARDWSLIANTFVNVNAIFKNPAHWHSEEQFTHHGKKVFIALEGCKQTELTPGGMFFPDMLRSEHHAIRSVLEAYAKQTQILGEGGNANGLAIQPGRNLNVSLEVTTAQSVSMFTIDRFD